MRAGLAVFGQRLALPCYGHGIVKVRHTSKACRKADAPITSFELNQKRA